jgi:RHH-type transcriptional regulator, proline utilization regulon repressor / proline dehydrogenase / delta 1-pyrroline-5-carboxylate dehydrogenase
VQEDIAPHFTDMLFGAMEELAIGNPWSLATDVGPVIDAEAEAGIRAHIDQARKDGRLLRDMTAPKTGHFIAPTVIRVRGIKDMQREIFGPVLHVATFATEDLPKVVEDINSTGYGLTFGLHTRIDSRVQDLTEALHIGNIYVNRNQIGAVVGSQPFGGEGMSGTGPKAGGPDYLHRFTAPEAPSAAPGTPEGNADPAKLQAALTAVSAPQPIATRDLPGPTGESNRLTLTPRAPLLCLGPGRATAEAQARAVEALGGSATVVTGALSAEVIARLAGFSGLLWWGDAAEARAYARALAARKGPILPVITAMPDRGHVTQERHVCVDTTASGGNAQLLAEAGSA